jgi:hypothetical protein
MKASAQTALTAPRLVAFARGLGLAAPLVGCAAFVAVQVMAPTPQKTLALSAGDFRAAIDRSGAPLECAIYARERSGVALFGDARSWWSQARGRYPRASRPSVGAVMVMDGTGDGHVAVVTHVLNERQIVIDHANWLGEGEIVTDALVEDVSETNDWSAVKVWNAEADEMGVRAYPVLGFILPTPS